jgi:hypothetical protein
VTFSYSFAANWDFYRTAFARYRRQKPKRNRTIAVSIVVAAVPLLAWIYGRSSDAVWTPIPKFALISGAIGGAIGGAVGGATAYALARILLRRRIKCSPNCGVTVSVTLDGEGLHGTEPHIDPQRYLQHVLKRTADHPINCIEELLLWNLAYQLQEPAHALAA